jgi:hypothetical protein
MFILNTSTPSSIILFRISFEEEAGPIVANIFVLEEDCFMRKYFINTNLKLNPLIKNPFSNFCSYDVNHNNQ